MTEFKVPELGENVAGGDVMRVMVNVGDTIARDQPVLELETDKATIEVPSSVAGTVKEVRVKKGDKVKVGAVVLTLDESGNGAAAAAAKTDKAQAGSAPAETAAKTAAEPAAREDAQPADAPKPEPHKILSMPARGSVADAGRDAAAAP